MTADSASSRSPNGARGAKKATRLAVRCPRCRLVIAPRMPTLAPHYCPRCLAQRRMAVKLEQLPVRVVDPFSPAPQPAD